MQIFQFATLEIGRMKVISRSQNCSKSRLQSIQLTGQYDENKLHINSKSYFELVQASAKVEQEQQEQLVELGDRIGLVLDYSLAVGAQEIIAKAC